MWLCLTNWDISLDKYLLMRLFSLTEVGHQYADSVGYFSEFILVLTESGGEMTSREDERLE